MARVKPCRVCREPLVLVKIPTVDGTERRWQVQLRGYPALACPQKHEQREAYDGFNNDWHEALTSAPDLWLKPPFWPSGIWKRKLPCAHCNGRTEPASHTETRAVTPGKQGHYTFEIGITGEFLRCAGCGHYWIYFADSDVFEALATALSTAGIRRY